MLFASAGFLFVFLPLFLLIYALSPDKGKCAVILIGSIAFYVIANLNAPFSILVLWLTVLFHFFAGMALSRWHDRILLVLFLAVDVMAFFSLRLLCNQMLPQYYFTFPVGASLYLLMGASYLIEHYRDPSLRSDDLAQAALYLTFFPIMLAGPLIRFRDFAGYMKNLSCQMGNVARGMRLLTVGLIKTMAVAAVLTEAYDNILQYSDMQVNVWIGSISLVMMYLIVFFIFSGYSDMGVGICIMLGIPLHRDYRNPLQATSPMAYLKGFFASFYAFVEAYVMEPLARLEKLPMKLRRALGLTVYLLLLTLWFRVDARTVPIALPLLIAILLEELTPIGSFIRNRRLGKLIGWIFTFLLTSLFWTVQQLGSYGKLFEYIRNLLEATGSYQSLYTYATSIGFDFIIVAVIALSILMPLSHSGNTLAAHAPAKLQTLADAVISVILLTLFVMTLVYFMPQFPQYAVEPYSYFVI